MLLFSFECVVQAPFQWRRMISSFIVPFVLVGFCSVRCSMLGVRCSVLRPSIIKILRCLCHCCLSESIGANSVCPDAAGFIDAVTACAVDWIALSEADARSGSWKRAQYVFFNWNYCTNPRVSRAPRHDCRRGLVDMHRNFPGRGRHGERSNARCMFILIH